MRLDIPAKYPKISRRRYFAQNGPLPDKIMLLGLKHYLPYLWAGTHHVICQDFAAAMQGLPETHL